MGGRHATRGAAPSNGTASRASTCVKSSAPSPPRTAANTMRLPRATQSCRLSVVMGLPPCARRCICALSEHQDIFENLERQAVRRQDAEMPRKAAPKSEPKAPRDGVDRLIDQWRTTQPDLPVDA